MSAVRNDALFRDEKEMEIFQKIKNLRSCVVFLPTRSEMVHIASRVITTMAESGVSGPAIANGKRTFFLVNTVNSGREHGDEFAARLGNLRVSNVCTKNNKNAGEERWTSVLRENEVLVMTIQGFLNALKHGYVTLDRVNLIVFEEYSDATGGHPIAEVMKAVTSLPAERRPKTLGFGVDHRKSGSGRLQKLADVFDGEIITFTFEKTTDSFGAEPTEIIENVKKPCIAYHTRKILARVVSESMTMLKMVKADLKDESRLKILRSAFRDIEIHTEENGLFVGYTCCQNYLEQLRRYMLELGECDLTQFMLYTMNQICFLRKVLYDGMGSPQEYFTSDLIQNCSTGKIKYLFDRVRVMERSDKFLIFVEKTTTAIALHRILRAFMDVYVNMGMGMSVEFTIGGNENPLRNADGQQKRILERFNTGLINVLISTQTLKERIVVEECNCIIIYDGLHLFSTHIQSWIRAQKKESQYVILNHTPVKTESSHASDTRLKKIFGEDAKVEPVSSDQNKRKTTYSTSKGVTDDSEPALPIFHECCSTISENGKMPRNDNPDTGRHRVKRPSVIDLSFSKAHAVKMSKRSLPSDAEEENSNLLPSPSRNTVHSPIRVPIFLKNCRPRSYEVCHLHCLKFTSDDEVTIERHRLFHELMKAEKYNFGILTREKWPEVGRFAVYSDLAKVDVEVKTNYNMLHLKPESLNQISHFHKTLSMEVMNAVRKCFAFDNSDDCDNGYFIVPLKQDHVSRYEISWDCVRNAMKFPSEIPRPTNEEIDRQEYTRGNYLGKVVTQWYKPGVRYVVCEVSDTVSLKSRFLKGTYKDYFADKHKVISRRPRDQPMLLVRPIQMMKDNICPRTEESTERSTKKLQNNDATYLAPEFCYVYPFPAVFWYKSTVLPSVLHRIHHLLLAEDLRQRIVHGTHVGSLTLSKDEVQRKTTRKLQVAEHTLETIVDEPMPGFTGPMSFALNDPEGRGNYYETALDTILYAKGDIASSFAKTQIPFVTAPELSTLRMSATSEPGPTPAEVLEAITLKESNDVYSLERLETLGDSCLKYIMSFYLFAKNENWNEGEMTMKKNSFVSNKNLFRCGSNLDIGSYIKVLRFSSRELWRPPGFSVPSCFLEDQPNRNVDASKFSWLLKLDIPAAEQFSGVISENTQGQDLENTNVDNPNAMREIDLLLGRLQLQPKNISDVLEALLAVYSLNIGVERAIQVLHYFGVLEEGDFVPRCLPVQDEAEVYRIFPGLVHVEEVIRYQFKNKTLAMQALTHPSYLAENRMTDSYEKFEFLGDAILDFLITSFLYENHQHLDPGQLTSLRSALVNNSTFGSLTVRLGLHRFLLCNAEPVLAPIRMFVEYQKKMNHAINNNTFETVVIENGMTVAEDVETPKVLGDIFESLAAAIFVDCGFDLNAVWQTYYNFMRIEIEKFSRKIPINPVRQLHEAVNPKFDTLENTDDSKKCYVSLEFVTPAKKTLRFVGRGESNKAAKRAASKFALANLNNHAFAVKV